MDPFDRQIVAALKETRLDWNTFEACMGDLLRDTFPGLVPVPGGNDAGMDAAVADGRGEPFPLVCTTSRDDVKGNLTRNLESYKRRKLPRRLVALATSQVLTPPNRRDLERRAKDQGFTMLQIFDQRAIADRLYNNSRWCRDLLGLTGRPSALSKVPKTRRALLAIDLVGRDADVEWLETTSGDRLLHGEPGSGKTCLARRLAEEGRALFLTGTDETHVAEALREQRPEVIVVDDAHRDLEPLDMLRHLREREIGARFSILAISWTGERARVAEALGTISEDRVRRLELLPFRDILEVIRQVGVQGPDELLRVLADQAANKPGLAVTLALLCLQGDWQKIVEGEALRATLMPFFEDLVGREVTPFLAAIGLGGDRGMPLSVVERFLDFDPGNAWVTANDLAAGGVLAEVEKGVMAVWPHDLRSALLRHVFFGGSVATLDHRKLLEQAPSFPHAVKAVLAAVHRGAEVPDQELRELVLRSGPTEIVPGFRSPDDVEVWRGYTALGDEQARWALERYPAEPLDLARDALRNTPRAAISKLLERAAHTTGSRHSQPSYPLRILKNWLEDLDVPAESIQRRKQLVRQAKVYLRDGGRRGVGMQALFLALSPRLESSSMDLLGERVTIRSGLLPLARIGEMTDVWEEIREAVGVVDAETWPFLTGGLWSWIYPSHVLAGQDLPEKLREQMHAFAALVLEDLAARVDGPGLAAGLVRLARKMNLDLSLELDPIFELLYPAEDKEAEAEATEAIRELAARWAVTKRPAEAAKSLAWYESEADRIAHLKWPPRAQELCRLMAEDVPNPAPWLAALVDVEIPSALIQPFLEKTVKLRPKGWKRLVEKCLGAGSLMPFAAALVLEQAAVPDKLRELAFDKVIALPWLVERLSWRNELPLAILKGLLLHADWKVAVAAAVGVWLTEPRGQVGEAVAEPWRAAIISASGDEREIESLGFQYWLGEILGKDSKLAFAWVRKLVDKRDLEPRPVDNGTALDKALAVLESHHRIEILDSVSEPLHTHRLLQRLVGESSTAYRKLLATRRLRQYQLQPLAWFPDSRWTQWALMALAEDHDPREVAGAAFGGIHSYTKSGQSYWGEWERAFAELESHPDGQIREVARQGRRIARERVKDAERLQRLDKLAS